MDLSKTIDFSQFYKGSIPDVPVFDLSDPQSKEFSLKVTDLSQ